MKDWILKEVNYEDVLKIAEKNNISAKVANILLARGITKINDINAFFSCESIESPYKFADMRKAVERINKAIDTKESICIYGDYDVDGVTSTSLLYLHLKSLGAKVSYYIPKRHEEGYGMNIEAIEKIAKDNVNLIITVDNGISAHEEIKKANELGMEVIITDHHRIHEGDLPDALAIINPNRKDCDSKYKNYAGVGVVFKLIMALEDKNENLDDLLEKYSDIVAIGTVSDMVELLGENRILVNIGIKKLKNTKNLGIKALLEESGIYNNANKLSTRSIAFSLAPRINSAGRLDHAKKAVELFVLDNEQDTKILAENLNKKNKIRQKIQDEILIEINNLLKKEPYRFCEEILIIEGENWHPGVIGIVASNITNSYGKPCIILSINGNTAVASGRSVEGFSLYSAISECSDLFVKFGGHPMAVGLTIKTDKIDEFKIRINNYLKKVKGGVKLPAINVDCKLDINDVSLKLIDELKTMEPYGEGNPEPIFALYKMELINIITMGKGNHLRLRFKSGDSYIEALKFYTNISKFPYQVGDVLDLAVTLDRNEYRGLENVAVIIKDIHIHNINYNKILKSKNDYEKFKRGEKLNSNIIKQIKPSREDFVKVYKYINKNKVINNSLDILISKLNDDNINYAKLAIIIDVLNELNILKYNMNEYLYEIEITSKEKVDLNSSSILQKI